MRVVIDTNVIAYLLFGEQAVAEESAALVQSCDELLAPTSWKAELLNTVWLAVREGMLPREDGVESLATAEQLDIHSIDPQELWSGAYTLALDANHPAYDTLFVELAARESIPLVTFDNGILTKFPEIAKRPRDLVD